MGITVSLQEIVDALEVPAEWRCYLNIETGEIVTVTGEGEILPEDTDLEESDLDSEAYLPLPDKFEIHEWSIMQEFSQERNDSSHRDQLLDAIHGAGAFRHFKSTIRRLGIEQDWYSFRKAALEETAREWLKDNGIAYR